MIRAFSRRPVPVVFLLWGRPAQTKRKFIDESVHKVIATAHPQSRANAKSPLIGVKVFSQTNKFLKRTGRIDWDRF